MENRYHVSINHIARLVILIANKRLSKISINRNLKKKSHFTTIIRNKDNSSGRPNNHKHVCLITVSKFLKP